MSQTVLFGALESAVGGAVADRDRLWIPLGELPAATGWTAKPEGLCRGDLPVWQGIYDEHKDRGFVVIAVGFDSGGPAAVRDFIRPAQLAPMMMRFMGWGQAMADRAAVPAYPCVIDERHLLGELYGIVNVPTAVWIDEDGAIVRPPEAPGATDAFRSMNLATREVPKERAVDGQARRKVYV